MKTWIPLASIMISNSYAMETAWNNGPTYDITYDSNSNRIRVDATVPENMYLGITFGQGMIGVDNVIFQGKNDGVVVDSWSYFYGLPLTDSQQDWNTDLVKTKTNGVYTFTAFRNLDTGDSEDRKFTCGEGELDFQWVGHDSNPEIVKHTFSGDFKLNVPSDC